MVVNIQSHIMKECYPMEMQKISGNPKEISEAFGIPVKTLAQLRWLNSGPKYYKPGKIIYFYSDVEAWLKQFPVKTKDSEAAVR